MHYTTWPKALMIESWGLYQRAKFKRLPTNQKGSSAVKRRYVCDGDNALLKNLNPILRNATPCLRVIVKAKPCQFQLFIKKISVFMGSSTPVLRMNVTRETRVQSIFYFQDRPINI